ncbi:hypothetical protein DMENIID0001_137520 [Sergentomyia squamirostris]
MSEVFSSCCYSDQDRAVKCGSPAGYYCRHTSNITPLTFIVGNTSQCPAITNTLAGSPQSITILLHKISPKYPMDRQTISTFTWIMDQAK